MEAVASMSYKMSRGFATVSELVKVVDGSEAACPPTWSSTEDSEVSVHPVPAPFGSEGARPPKVLRRQGTSSPTLTPATPTAGEAAGDRGDNMEEGYLGDSMEEGYLGGSYMPAEQEWFPMPEEKSTGQPPPEQCTSTGPLRLCGRRFRGRACACCDVPPQNGNGWHGRSRLRETEFAPPPHPDTTAPWTTDFDNSSVPRMCGASEMTSINWMATPITSTAAFVDTHCHLEEVLQMVRRHTVAATLNKSLHEFTAEELANWRILGWVQDDHSAADASPTCTWNPTWDRFWVELLPAEREAAAQLGYEAASWDRNQWLLPREVPWRSLDGDVRQCLTVLGETIATWDDWSSGGGSGSIVNSNDLRRWGRLSMSERAAASALGFSEDTWNSEEMADVGATISSLFGPNFEGCVTQGCDVDSIEYAKMLALAHPKVYASFGCHPKAAWTYDDKLEQRLLSCMLACGPKAVAWGEFGLDYSHPFYGRLAANRRTQKDIFARQLQLAIKRGFPLVVHSRAADRDTLRMMRRWVPRDWKVHVHSFRGSIQFMEALVSEFRHAYIGIPGIVTMQDPDAQNLCRQCPLEKMVLETDAPYLPLQSSFFSHPGQIPEIAIRVAEIKGCPVNEVFAAVRENARTVYGI